MGGKAGIGYIKGLDMLRFIAASGVILHHLSLRLGEVHQNYLGIFEHTGAFFLNLFFVISGYLIATILFKELDNGQFSFKKFYLRRILRIWPMYFFVVLLFILIIPLIKGVAWDDIGNDLLFASLFITNFQLLFSAVSKASYVIIWSVGIEEQIYIIFPLLLMLFRKNRALLAVLLIITGVVSWLILADIITPASAQYNNSPYFFTTSYFFFFGLGCLLALIIAKGAEVIKKVNRVLLNPIVQIVVIIGGFGYLFTDDYTNCSTIVYLISNGLFTSYLVYIAANGKLVFDRLNEKTSRFLGNVSYSMYLIHIRVIPLGFFVVRKIASPSMFTFDIVLPVIVIALTVGLSALCHYLIERPFLKLKKKYTVVPNK
jgi:peptidoglycan/LPS O-acetylase OafA/YrhL